MASNDFIQEIVNKDYSELVEIGKGAFSVIYEYLEPILGEKLVFAVVLGLVTTVAASDRYCSNAELNLVNDITGLGFSAASFRELCGQANDPEFRANLNDIVKTADAEHKEAILILCIIMASADESVTPDEMRRMAELFA